MPKSVFEVFLEDVNMRLALPFGKVHRKIHDFCVLRDDSKSKNMILYQEPSIAIPKKSLATIFLRLGLRVSPIFYPKGLSSSNLGSPPISIKIWAVQRPTTSRVCIYRIHGTGTSTYISHKSKPNELK